MDRFPCEITTQILSVLPLRYVLRCRSVCKTWRSIIDDSRFRHSHYTRSIESNDSKSRSFLFSLQASDEVADEVYLVEEDGDSSTNWKSSKMNFSYPMPIGSLKRDSVNGLFCYTVIELVDVVNDCGTYICNPITRECIRLPSFDSSELENAYLAPGFGFDTSSKEFKVVQLLYPSMSSAVLKLEAHVFTLGSNSWRKIKDVPHVSCCRDSTSVCGSLHWGLYSTNNFILSFKLQSEEFGFIPLPEDKPFLGYVGHIMNLDGCLSVADPSLDPMEVWIMKDYGVKESWTKLVITTTYLPHDLGDFVRQGSFLPISYGKEDEMVLLCRSRILVIYNVASGMYTPIHIDGYPENQYREYEVHPYCGNLLPLQPAEF